MPNANKASHKIDEQLVALGLEHRAVLEELGVFARQIEQVGGKVVGTIVLDHSRERFAQLQNRQGQGPFTAFVKGFCLQARFPVITGSGQAGLGVPDQTANLVAEAIRRGGGGVHAELSIRGTFKLLSNRAVDR